MPNYVTGRMSLIVSGCCLMALAAAADDAADTKSGKSAEPIVSRETFKAVRERLVSSITAKGTIEGDSRTELKVHLKSWTNPLIVEQSIDHGTLVKKGQLLLQFDAEKLEEQVRATREDRESAALAIRLAELELPILKAQLPLDLQAAEQHMVHAAENLERFLKIDKPFEMESVAFALRSAEFSLESSREELAQLEKMYRDKDLTEETEQMILKRYKFALANAEFHLVSAKIHMEQTLKIALPRREVSTKLEAVRSELAWQKAREELPLNVRQKELALEKQRHEERRARHKLAELEQDLREMTITAPTDGILYYGRYAHGQWSGPAAAAYLKGGTLPANEGLLTIISRGKLFLHTEVDEKEIADVKAGQPARITPTITPLRKLNGKVARVVPIPQGGKYHVVIAITQDVPEALVPGMTGSARIVTHQSENALTVPSSAVFEDSDNETFYVYRAGDKPEKQTVKTGVIGDSKTEILDGLKEGDEILATKP